MLVVVLEEDPALPINPAIRAENQVVGGMVGVGGSETLEDDVALVGFVVPVVVPQENEVRARGDQNAPVPEFKTERAMDPGELDHAVGFAVPVLIGQDKEGVVHFLEWFPFGVGGPSGGPEPTLGVHLHLNGVDQFGELNLVGEEIDLETLANRHAFSALFGAEVSGRTFLARIRTPASTPDVRNNLDRRWDVGIVDFVLFTLSGGPNELVPVGGHDVEHHQFVLKDLGIGLIVYEAQSGTAPHIIPVGCPVAVVPMPVFVQYRFSQFFMSGRGADLFFQQGLGNDLSNLLVSQLVEVYAVDRQGLLFLFV